jgi:hypothetical protein
MTSSGPVRRCASFGDADMGDGDMGDDFGDFGETPDRSHIAGPLVGGGLAQVGTLGAKMLLKGKPAAKWAGAIGFGLGALASGILIARPKTRAVGISSLITAAIVGIPRQIEDMLGEPAAGAHSGYLGVITPERELAAAEQEMAAAEQEMLGAQEQPIELLDSGSGSTGVLGVITPEREMAGAGGVGGDIELLGFGSNFLSQQ